MTGGDQDSDGTYLAEVRSFDHAALASHPAYLQLRQALSDLANEAHGELKLTDWLNAVRDMALTTPYSDGCTECPDPGMYWPHAVERKGNWISGSYRCSRGHTWTCSYAVDFMESI